MAKGVNRRRAIRHIAEQRRVSLAVAAHIYACMSIPRKQALAERASQIQEKIDGR
jgi:hypothetical protein